MKIHLHLQRLVWLAGFTALSAGAFGQTQPEMNQQAYADYQKTDRELNQTYQKILAKYRDDQAFLTTLKASQRIWIQFRDAEVKMKYPNREPGYYVRFCPCAGPITCNS